jgi:hypothetical protein
MCSREQIAIWQIPDLSGKIEEMGDCNDFAANPLGVVALVNSNEMKE